MSRSNVLMAEQYNLRFNSCPNNITKVESFVKNLAEQYKLAPDVHGNILISLTEAVNNAIIHGNRYDEQKKVEILMRRERNRLAFHITDEGRGFDVDNIPDPTCGENLFTIGGRGVFIMRQLADDISFHNGGSTVEIQFSLKK